MHVCLYKIRSVKTCFKEKTSTCKNKHHMHPMYTVHRDESYCNHINQHISYPTKTSLVTSSL